MPRLIARSFAEPLRSDGLTSTIAHPSAAPSCAAELTIAGVVADTASTVRRTV